MATLQHIPVTLPETKCGSKAVLRDIIGTFLTKEWPLVEPDTLTVHHQTCYANISCHVRRPKPENGSPSEPLDVFIKLHRASAEVQIFKHLMPEKQAEALVCHEYAQTGWGAAMYGFFQTQDGTFGRVDEFLDARNMVPEDVQDAGIRADVARAFASFHSMNTFTKLQPAESFYAALIGGLEKYRGSDRLKSIGKSEGIDVVRLVDYDFATRVEAVVDTLASIGAKTTMCIHDVCYANVMVKNDAPQRDPRGSRVVLIDFEFALQNYRAFDIGAHFMQKMSTWSAEKAKAAKHHEYTADEMRHFCEAYAARWNQVTGDSDTVEQVLTESQYGYMLAIAWNVYNMLCVIDDQGDVGMLNLADLNRLLDEFSERYSRLGLDATSSSE